MNKIEDRICLIGLEQIFKSALPYTYKLHKPIFSILHVFEASHIPLARGSVTMVRKLKYHEQKYIPIPSPSERH